MKCYVYERFERVIYVVGVVGVSNPLAEALIGSPPDSIRHHDEGKPFSSMNDKRVMYVERIGSMSARTHAGAMRERAKGRAHHLNVEHADLHMELEPKKRRKK